MGKRRYPRKGSFGLRRIRISPSLALSNLVAGTAIATAVSASAENGYRVTSCDTVWTFDDLVEDEGPVTVGYAHSDYSVTEIKECLDSNASINVGNMIAREQANRLVRVVGSFSKTGTINDGRRIKTRLNWKFGEDDLLNIFAYNEATGSITTGSRLHVVGDMWIKDD